MEYFLKQASQENALNPLCKLPEELVDNIVAFLSAGDSEERYLCALRLTCKHLYRKSLHYFGRVVLHTVRTDLCFISLQRLMRLAADDRLKDHVHHLLIRGAFNSCMGAGFQWMRHSTGPLDMKQSLGARWLRHVLLSLPNCRSFSINLNYGWNDSSAHSRLGPSDGINMITNIIAETGIPVRSFHVYAYPSSSRFAFNDVDPRCLQFDTLKNQTFINSWAHVEKLRFQHNFIPGNIGEWVARVITLAPKLKTLEISYDYTPEAQIITTRLASGPGVLSELRELVLTEASEMDSDELLTLLRFTCRMLQCLKLERLQLKKGGTWIPLLTLLDQFPLLEDLHLFWLSTGQRKVLHFVSLTEYIPKTLQGKFQHECKQFWGMPKTVYVAYRGDSMSVFLNALLMSAQNE
ncbi:hypothetical protein ANOM_005916 [Aspergillus nomiae NRRL 13137]|uniref:F-box domain-containing protein n=1 Tax=Aspergillus nomiae NRRL (strain ATCC 15546 / NRRL 13137 / CBS 260.88 / M93) TaxID=1509407 RepID=A0A0L1J7I2_ASPN3|nr:uncharacterized protein ANOM_005916 [Aspergillus nomiae NRRL 13137]KNG87363.1 hypothetical protein ANOM_005916 [Aspergillus nomiae NRRL 13137]